MTIYKGPGSAVLWTEFTVNGNRHRMSTGETDQGKAAAFEATARAKVKAEADRNAAGTNEMSMWDLAQSWLTASRATHKDFRNNESRVRKLFGTELQQKGREWVEKPGGRYGITKGLKTHEITQALLSTLKAERIKEGCKAGTINREMSLLQSLLGFAESLGAPSLPRRSSGAPGTTVPLR